MHTEIFIDLYIHVPELYTYIYFVALTSEGAGKQQHPPAMITATTQVLVSKTILQRRNWTLMIDSRTGRNGIHKMHVECLVNPESKEMLKRKREHVKRTPKPSVRAPMAKAGQN